MKAIIVALFLIASASAITLVDQTFIAQLAPLLPLQGHQFSQPLDRDVAVFVEIFDKDEKLTNFICLGEDTTITVEADIGSNNERHTVLSVSLAPAEEEKVREQSLEKIRRKEIFGATATTSDCPVLNSPKSLDVLYSSQLTLGQARFAAFSEGTFPTLKAEINGVPVSFGLNGHTIKISTNDKANIGKIFEWTTGTHSATNSTGSRADCPECSYTPIQCPTSIQQAGTVTKYWVALQSNQYVLKSQTVLGNSGCVMSGTLNVVSPTAYIAPSGTSCPTNIKYGMTILACFGSQYDG